MIPTIQYHTSSVYKQELRHILYTISLCYDVKFAEANDPSQAQITIGSQEDDTIYFSNALFDVLYSDSPYFECTAEVITIDGKEDILSTIFYLVNCLQELNPNPTSRDHFGRYKSSYSFQTTNGLMTENIVEGLIDRLILLLPGRAAIHKKLNKSKIFLSHDMDTIYGSLIQDTYWSVKNMRPFDIAKVLLENTLKGPSWLNIDRIMKIESEYDFHSTFFWLTEKGKTIKGLRNSDYDIGGPRVRQSIKTIEDKGWYNGLHKSIGTTSFSAEMNKVPAPVSSNRYHYLFFDVFRDFKEIEKAQIKLDCSLGFADQIGFRNGFGTPVHLFDIQRKIPYDFVECPLHCMDTTYLFYQKKSGDMFANDVIDFVEKNRFNCVLSLLFHNNYLSDYKYKEYLKAFKRLLGYFYENQYECITEKEIIDTYYVKY